jgi:hypothetical protein
MFSARLLLIKNERQEERVTHLYAKSLLISIYFFQCETSSFVRKTS